MLRRWIPFGLTLPRRPEAMRAAAGGLLVSAVAWYFGADAWHAILFGAALAAAASVLALAWRAETHDTAWRESASSGRAGSRQEVARLSWATRGRFRRVGKGAIWTAERIAQQRLANHGLDLLNPSDRERIEQLIGTRAYSVLVGDHRRAPFLRSFLHCLDALDAMDGLGTR